MAAVKTPKAQEYQNQKRSSTSCQDKAIKKLCNWGALLGTE